MTRLLMAAILALGAGLAALPASAAGLSFIKVPIADAPPMAGAVWYPCATLPGEVPSGGGLTLPGVKDCPIAGDHLPLIVMSHGFGGTFASHHDTAEALADAGFIVAAITHPADKVRGQDPSGGEAIAALTSRPEDIVHLIDFMLGPWPQATTGRAPERTEMSVSGFGRRPQRSQSVWVFRHAAPGGPDVIAGQVHMLPSERREMGEQIVGHILGFAEGRDGMIDFYYLKFSIIIEAMSGIAWPSPMMKDTRWQLPVPRDKVLLGG